MGLCFYRWDFVLLCELYGEQLIPVVYLLLCGRIVLHRIHSSLHRVVVDCFSAGWNTKSLAIFRTKLVATIGSILKKTIVEVIKHDVGLSAQCKFPPGAACRIPLRPPSDFLGCPYSLKKRQLIKISYFQAESFILRYNCLLASLSPCIVILSFHNLFVPASFGGFKNTSHLISFPWKMRSLYPAFLVSICLKHHWKVPTSDLCSSM